MEVVRTKKRLMTSLSIILFSVVLSASILFVHASGIAMSDPVYSIIPDVIPLVAIDPANPPWSGNYTTFRFVDGLLYSGNTIVDGSLGDVLAYAGVASQKDVQEAALTVPDLVSSFTQYFGSYPYEYTRRSSGNSSTTSSVTVNSLRDLLARLGIDTQIVLTNAVGSQYLNSSGGISDATVNMSLTTLLRYGLLGIGNDLMGNTGNINYSRRVAGSSSNASVNVTSLAQLLSVIGSDLQNDLNTSTGYYYLDYTGKRVVTDVARNLPFLVGNGFSGLRVNLIGTGSKEFISGTGESISASDVLGGLEAMNTQLIKTLTNQGLWTFLDSNGQPAEWQNMTLTNVLQRGLLGLSYNLRGSTTDAGVPIQLYDYTTGQYSETVMAESLFDLNATGFEQLQNMFALYMFSHGTDLDIKERENMQQQAEQFVEDFTSPGGKGTMTTNDMSDMANVSSSMTSNFSSDATVSDIFTQLGNGDNYSFFSDSVLNDLEGSVISSYSFYDDGYIDFLNPHLDDFRKAVGSSW